MKKEREHFIYGLKDEDGDIIIEGAIKRGVSEDIAISIFDEIMDFASYAFNKSHAAAYAVVAYQTAYLKCFYPTEYMAALLSSTMGATDKVVGYIADCADMKIKLLPPDINKSYYRFTVEDGCIRFGLEAVKNVGHKMLLQIAEERDKNGLFTSFTDFCERMSGADLNKRSLESLIKCGAFDSMKIKRSQLIAVYDDLLSSIASDNRQNVEGQISLFGDDSNAVSPTKKDELPNIDEFDMKDLLAMEKDTIGLYLSGHPLEDYRQDLKRLSNTTTAELLELALPGENGEYIIQNGRFKDGDFVMLGGIITARRNKTTRNNTQMAFLTFEDLYGTIDVIVFPKSYEQYSSVMIEDSIVVLKGRLSLRDDEAPKLIASQITPLDMLAKTSEVLYLKLENGKENLWEKIKPILQKNHGSTPVSVYFEKMGQVKRVSADLFCNCNVTMINELKANLGEECVKIK